MQIRDWVGEPTIIELEWVNVQSRDLELVSTKHDDCNIEDIKDKMVNYIKILFYKLRTSEVKRRPSSFFRSKQN